jgi:hypothetical protein
MFKFGDVFRYDGIEYVFLAKIDGLVYAAEILNEVKGRSILTLEARLGEKKKSGEILFCYVILQTEEFKNRMAHLHGAKDGDANIQFDFTSASLSNEDLVCMKREIMEGPLPLILKEAIKDIDIQ